MAKDVDPHEQTKAESIRPGKMVSGRPIGGYELIDVLGEGGMGVVWAAHDPNLDRRVAIKVLKRSDAAPSLRKRLLREARAMARLKHPNVLTVYEVGTEGDRDFIAMELVEGGSLDEWLDRHPPRADVMAAVLAAGRGLAAAHAAGLVHRDFKPHNVLRSKEGRVLVTDFGLARGMGEDSSSGGASGPDFVLPPGAELDVTIRPTSVQTDSVLDSPLTHTGAMIGTPAYMAPEQFIGGAPDPRTDQFAFCVTAWQALTGTRPYTGQTIDELRKAASAGIAPNVKVDMLPAVRAALVRGLDPDPAKRWPTLDDLLDTLDHAVKPKRPWWLIPAAALAAVALVGATVLVARRGELTTTAIAPGCAPGEDLFAETWTPQSRGELSKALTARGIELNDAQLTKLAAPLDAYRERWSQLFATACKAPEQIGPRQRDCLLGARDQTSALVLVLREGPPQMYGRLDLHGMLPDLGACAGNSPGSAPRTPEDPQLRAKVVRLLAKALSLSGSPDFMTAYPAIEDEARAVGWPPMLPIVQMGIGNELLRRGEYTLARVTMKKVIDAAPETRDGRTVAIARFGLLEASLNELESPASDAKPGELHHEIDRLLVYARKEVKLTGNELVQVSALAGFEARAQLDLAQRGLHQKAYDEALAQARKAEAGYAAAGDLRRSARLTALVLEILAELGGATTFDDAIFAARTAEAAMTAAKLDPEPALDAARAWIELQRGEFFLAHQLYARMAGPLPPARGVERTGIVVDAAGKPVRNARVVVWRGTLVGDPVSTVTDPSTLDGDRSESGADGTFTVRAEPGDSVIAEYPRLRSTPQLVGTGTITVKLEPTTILPGTVDRPGLIDAWVTARYASGANIWELRVPARRDRSFQLSGLPRTAPQVAIIGTEWQGQRRVIGGVNATKLTWPVGQALEVILRGPVEPDAMVWIFRAVQVPKTRAEVEALAARATEVAWGALTPIGSDNTDAGRAVYQPGDRHVVISGNVDGAVSVCVARSAAPPSPVECRIVRVAQGVDVREPDDEPWPVAVTPVVFTDGDRGKPAP
ncbi:MAG: protein kinase [Deltaproteobacteria bacterium]|nr:protein kinase [Deltaproteobacteria bacterium]